MKKLIFFSVFSILFLEIQGQCPEKIIFTFNDQISSNLCKELCLRDSGRNCILNSKVSSNKTGVETKYFCECMAEDIK